jgi:hypothetical protein
MFLFVLCSCLWLARPAFPAPPRPLLSTFDVQHVGVVTDELRGPSAGGRGRRTALRHYTVATLRASFDQPLYVRRGDVDRVDRVDRAVARSVAAGGANATASARRRIDLVPANMLEGMTRLRCHDHIVESAREYEHDDDQDDGSLPHYLFAVTPTLARGRGAPGGKRPSRPLQTILDVVLESSPPMPNQYVAVLIFPPPQHYSSRMFFGGDGLEFEEEEEEDTWRNGRPLHPLQFWSPDELSACRLEFLLPEMQVSPRGDAVSVSGPNGDVFYAALHGGGSGGSSSSSILNNSNTHRGMAATATATTGLPLERVRPPRLDLSAAHRVAAAVTSRYQEETRDNFAAQIDSILE